ncbi:MAG: glycosyltransferase [Gemmatimonadaceae bacterium]|nr:glycosyltransferase [Gemmatimonadaceae bacterium]
MQQTPPAERSPVFLDPTGRRWRRARSVALAFVAVIVLLGAYVVVGVLVPPILPTWAAPQVAVARRQISARRRRLLERPPHPAVVAARRAERASAAVHGGRATALHAAFYVNWDDDAWQSLQRHVTQLDLVIAEWGFLRTSDLRVRWDIDPRVTSLLARTPAADRPRVLAMVTNVDSGGATFSGARVARLLADPRAVARFVDASVRLVDSLQLGGIALDLELVPARDAAGVTALLQALRARLEPRGALVAVTVAANTDAAVLRAWGAAADLTIAMLYDEHSDRDDPGPVASDGWFAAEAARVTQQVPAEKVLLALGAFGYDWTDAVPAEPASAMTYTETLAAARRHQVMPTWDVTQRSPALRWTDPDSTEHLVWYLDATTGWNSLQHARTLGVAGAAIWRLGAEDPALWQVFGRGARSDAWAALRTLPGGYGVDLQGDGELLRVTAHPTPGMRELVHDSVTGLIADVRTVVLPQLWTVERTGAAYPHRVALTFDDGPDPTWTPAILDTLRARHAPAAFFVIGDRVPRQIALTRRLRAEGHEVGSHTFSHPNLARVSPFLTRVELDATARVLEAVLGERSRLFRPPYFGDAEPTTIDELAPVEVATALGYLTAGVHIDSQDWRRLGADAIVARTLAERPRGHVILLHDGGGDRAQTVAAIGPLIDSLRARGDTIVPLRDLLAPGAAPLMPPLPSEAARRRWVAFAGYGAVGFFEWGIATALALAVTLGVGRLILIAALALRRVHRERRQAPAPAFTPSVTVVVPAYREQNVIVATVRSLLAQAYDGALEIIVVDDGSPDDTYAIARNTFAADPRVLVLTQSNGGKATALNHGIARATGEVIVALDADTVFANDCIARLVAPLADLRVAAVAGNAKVGNRLNLVTRWQAVEYITSQNLERRAFADLNAITVVPGAVGAWRTIAVREAHGFSHDTLAEDQDLTIELRRRGWRIAFVPEAVAWTEAPDTLRTLARQRFRWCFGTLQCAWKHRDTLGRPAFGSLGMIAMPNTWIFQILLTAFSPLADLLFVLSLVTVGVIAQQHGATYARRDLDTTLFLYALFTLVDAGVAMLALALEPGEDRHLAWYVIPQRFVYRQVMYWVVLRSLLAAVRGRVVGWGSLERKATVPTLVTRGLLLVGLALGSAHSLRAQQSRERDGLQVTEVPATTAGHTLAIFWSGDGGWRELVAQISGELAARGVAVVGVNARAYISPRLRTPDEAAAATTHLIETYAAKWKRDRILLIGYSRGAGFAPFIYNRLAPELRARTDLVAMLGMEPNTNFEFHLVDLIRSVDRPTDLAAHPEIDRITGVPMLCMYGADEERTLCPALNPAHVTTIKRDGDHHFDRDYRAITEQLLEHVRRP